MTTASTPDVAGTPGTPGSSRHSGGPPIWFALFAAGGLLLGVLLVLAQVLGIGSGSPANATPPPTGAAAQRTHDLVQASLEAAAFQVQDPLTQFRPGESAALYAVPRRLLQVVLPSDPQGGYVVIYELPSANDADSVGRDFVRYLASGTGAIQYPRDAQFVIRRMGQTLVFFPWSPSVSPDPSVARLAATIESIGVPLTSQ